MFIRIEVYKMTNLEIMDRGVFYTWNAYMNAKQGTMSNEAIDVRAVDYSAQCLYNVINKPDSYAMYTRTDNLRKDMKMHRLKSGQKSKIVIKIVGSFDMSRHFYFIRLLMCFFNASKLSSLISCSIMQASSLAISGSTPR